MNIIGHKYIFLSISGTLVLGSLIVLLLWGLKLGIDFKGGSLLEIEYAGVRPSADDVRKMLQPFELGSVLVQPTGEKGMLLRFKHIDEELHQKMLSSIGTGGQNPAAAVYEKRFDTIGPTIGEELKRRSMLALMLAIGAIVLYIAWAFRHVSRPISSWKYGVVAIVALIHDVTIPAGIFSFLGHFKGVEIDALFITALLTILGFSVHDTIVVFDRVRENLHKLKTAEPYEETVNRSVNETIVRSINTSFTVLLVLITIFFWGGETTRYFSLALLIGVIFGVYSSIFVASPLLVIWNNFSKGSGKK